MARILSVSYSEVLLKTRQMLLEPEGHEIFSALGFSDGIAQCKQGGFDLFILGHSLPYSDKQELVTTFRKHSDAPIISLRGHSGQRPVEGVNFEIETDPEELLRLVRKVLRADAATA